MSQNQALSATESAAVGWLGAREDNTSFQGQTSPPQQYVLNPNSMPGNGWNKGTVIT